MKKSNTPTSLLRSAEYSPRLLRKKDINPFVITPIRQYANIPKLIEIESDHDGLPSFGL